MTTAKASSRPRRPKSLREEFFGSAIGFCESLLDVQTKAGHVVPLRFNPAQRHIIARKRQALGAGRAPRFLIPKARRMGVSTLESAFNYALICNVENQTAVTLADTDPKAAELFSAQTFFYDRHDPRVRPSRKTESSKSITLPSLNSSMRTATAGSVDFARGLTLQRVHGSEVAFWLARRKEQNAEIENLLAGITEAASHGEVTLESTANGNHGWWYETVHHAYHHPEDSEWTVIFLPWWEDPSYAIPIASDEEREEIVHSGDDRERWLMDTHYLLPEQIAWRRAKRSERAMRRLFFQEYPEILDESFLASGSCYWDRETIDGLETRCRVPVEETETRVVWERQVEGRRYVIGADVATGTPEGDYCAAGVLDARTRRQVARIHGKWRPREFAARVRDLAITYNRALIAPERNGVGEALITALTGEVYYSNLYFREEADTKGVIRKKIGWDTNGVSRDMMLDDLRCAMEQDQVGVSDKPFLGECRVFEDSGGGRYEARPGFHDDLVMAWAIAWAVRDVRPAEAQVFI